MGSRARIRLVAGAILVAGVGIGGSPAPAAPVASTRLPAVASERTRAQAPEVAVPARPLGVAALRAEYRDDPVGIHERLPRLSWQLRSDGRNVIQRSYRIQVAPGREELLEGVPSWDSGRVESRQSTHVEYAGPPLESATRYWWRVRVRDAFGRDSGWSEPAYWETGLLEPSDWRATWIEPGPEQTPENHPEPARAGDTASSTSSRVPQPAPYLRREFQVDGEVASARAWATAHGLYELRLNGRPVGDQVLAPGWTSYDRRLQVQAYDVTGLLQPGANAAGAVLGDGWWRGHVGFRMDRHVYGERLALLLQIRIRYSDGREQLVVSDGAWRWSTGPILLSDFFQGEVYDARREPEGWDRPGFDDGDWDAVREAGHRKDVLVGPMAPPVRRIQELSPVEVVPGPDGETLVDFGQNLVGRVRLRGRGEAGTTVVLRHGEALDADGGLYTANLRGAEQRVEYTFGGGGEAVYEPRFTFMGFRYVEVRGWPGPVIGAARAGGVGADGEAAADDRVAAETGPPDEALRLTAVVLHSDLESTGELETSNPDLNRLWDNIRWSQKGNFVDVPTDCPQRDERLGWTGDAQVFCRTAAFNFQVAGFFSKWLADLAADQHPDGAVPWVVPDVVGQFDERRRAAGSAGWGDAAVIVPWTLWVAYGDRRILERQYPSMRAWIEFMEEEAGSDRIWEDEETYHWGDWLAPEPTSKDLVATAFFAHSTGLTARVARILGRETEAVELESLRDEVVRAFREEFVGDGGSVGDDTQTALVLALAFDLLPREMRPAAADRLARDVREHDDHLTTGFLGTPWLLFALSEAGRLDVAYDLLLQDTHPSWLYPVRQGATTIWERWDGIRPDGSFQDPSMNSFNHYAYGAVGDWMARVVGGIRPDPAEPGYRHVVIEPRPGGGLSRARAALETRYGRVETSWEVDDDGLRLDVTVPANAVATVRLHGATEASVTEGGRPVVEAAGVRSVGGLGPEEDGVAVRIGSGRYVFRVGSRNRPVAPPRDRDRRSLQGTETGAETGHVIFLENGGVIRARSVEVEGDRVRLSRNDGIVVVPLAVVDRIVRDTDDLALRASPGAGAVAPGTPGSGVGTTSRESSTEVGPFSAGDEPAPPAGDSGRPPAGVDPRDLFPPPGDDPGGPGSWDELPADRDTPEYWRARKRFILELIRSIEERLAPLPEYDFPVDRILDGRILWVIRERQRLEERLERAREFLAGFEEMARQEGVPPGWLRLPRR